MTYYNEVGTTVLITTSLIIDIIHILDRYLLITHHSNQQLRWN